MSMSSVPCGMGNFDEDIDTSTFYPSAYQNERSKVKVCNGHQEYGLSSRVASGWSAGGPCHLFIEKILPAHLIECAERVRPAHDNSFRSNSSLYLLNRIHVSYQANEFGGIKFLWVKLLENLGNFQSQAHGARRETI